MVKCLIRPPLFSLISQSVGRRRRSRQSIVAYQVAIDLV